MSVGSPLRSAGSRINTWSPTTWIGIGAALALLLPALWYGPWLPLTDLVAYVGMDSYPPQSSYGPLHYYTFQFTYMGHAVLSRLLCDLQLPVRYQIVLFYLLQVGICFGVVWRLLERLVADPWWRSLGIALGGLAFWDAMFLWGGPLANSLAAAAMAGATFLVIREAEEPDPTSNASIAALVGASLFCHPLSVLFALVLLAVRLVFVPARRCHTAVMIAVVLAFAFVITKDSPPAEAGAAGGLRFMFSVNPREIGTRVAQLPVQDIIYVRRLFGACPITSAVVFVAFALIHVIGFVGAPYLALRRDTRPALRVLATLNAATAVLYFLSSENVRGPLPDWPQRILTWYAPFTFATGFITIATFLGQRVRSNPPLRPWRWAVPGALLVGIMVVQAGVFRNSAVLGKAVADTREQIVRSGVANAYVVVADIDRIEPFYLRAVPFILFSDPDIVARNIVLATEWHFQPRHSSRLVESWVDLGRPHYLARFDSVRGGLTVRLAAEPANRFPVIEGTNERRWAGAEQLAHQQFAVGAELFRQGAYVAAWEHFNTMVHLVPAEPEGWNDAGAALVAAGRPAEAVPYFQAALQRGDSTDTRLNLATALVSVGRADEALPQLRAVLATTPRDDRALKLLRSIQAVAPPTKR